MERVKDIYEIKVPEFIFITPVKGLGVEGIPISMFLFLFKNIFCSCSLGRLTKTISMILQDYFLKRNNKNNHHF